MAMRQVSNKWTIGQMDRDCITADLSLTAAHHPLEPRGDLAVPII